MEKILGFALIASFVFMVAALAMLVFKVLSFGKKEFYAAPAGDVKKGIIYAFGKGMLPWHKESAGHHLPSYIAGIIYHLAIFLSLFYLSASIISLRLPEVITPVLGGFILLGLLAGLGLLFKRLLSSAMRAVSCPDDLAANILVDVFLALAALHLVRLSPVHWLYLAATVMFLYIPLGKIRHCCFFFYVRILFGIFYGRRNIFPEKPPIA